MEYICVSEIFFFVCFVVVLVGCSHAPPSLRESVFQLGEHSVDPLLVVYVVDEGFAENAADYLKVRWVEVESRIHTLVRAQEGGF